MAVGERYLSSKRLVLGISVVAGILVVVALNRSEFKLSMPDNRDPRIKQLNLAPGFCARCHQKIEDEAGTRERCDLIDNNPKKWRDPKRARSEMPFWFTSNYSGLPLLEIDNDGQVQVLPPLASSAIGPGEFYFRYLKNADLHTERLFNFTDYWRLNTQKTIFDNVGQYEKPSGNDVEQLEKMWDNGEEDNFISGRNAWMKLDKVHFRKEPSNAQLDHIVEKQWRRLVTGTAAPDWKSQLVSIEQEIRYSHGADILRSHLRPLLTKYSKYVKRKRGVVVGSTFPWLEFEVLRVGASHVTTVEYLDMSSIIPEDHPRMAYYYPKEMERLVASGEWWKKHGPFDFAMSFSSIEHAGLGRYGDPLNPDGDLMEMAKLSCLVKPGGLIFLRVPVKCDCLKFNWIRLYGTRRYALLTECFRLVECENFALNIEHQPWFLDGWGFHAMSDRYLFVIPTIHEIKAVLNSNTDDWGVRGMKTALLTDLTDRFDDKLLLNGEFKMATMLDPRFKGSYFTDEESRLVTDDIVYAVLGLPSTQPADPIEEEPSNSEAPQTGFFRNRPTAANLHRPPSYNSREQIIRSSLSAYLMDPPIAGTADPLQWWHVNCAKFSPLSDLARKLLCIPPGSVDSERLFSVAGDNVTDKRTCLAPEKAELLIRTHYNLRTLCFDYKYEI